MRLRVSLVRVNCAQRAVPFNYLCGCHSCVSCWHCAQSHSIIDEEGLIGVITDVDPAVDVRKSPPPSNVLHESCVVGSQLPEIIEVFDSYKEKLQAARWAK